MRKWLSNLRQALLSLKRERDDYRMKYESLISLSSEIRNELQGFHRELGKFEGRVAAVEGLFRDSKAEIEGSVLAASREEMRKQYSGVINRLSAIDDKILGFQKDVDRLEELNADVANTEALLIRTRDELKESLTRRTDMVLERVKSAEFGLSDLRDDLSAWKQYFNNYKGNTQLSIYSIIIYQILNTLNNLEPDDYRNLSINLRNLEAFIERMVMEGRWTEQVQDRVFSFLQELSARWREKREYKLSRVLDEELVRLRNIVKPKRTRKAKAPVLVREEEKEEKKQA